MRSSTDMRVHNHDKTSLKLISSSSPDYSMLPVDLPGQWPSSCVSSDLISISSAGKTCVELGCGTGLVGICLARLGACAAISLTDGNSQSLENCCRNLQQNGVLFADHEQPPSSSKQVTTHHWRAERHQCRITRSTQIQTGPRFQSV